MLALMDKIWDLMKNFRFFHEMEFYRLALGHETTYDYVFQFIKPHFKKPKQEVLDLIGPLIALLVNRRQVLLNRTNNYELLNCITHKHSTAMAEFLPGRDYLYSWYLLHLECIGEVVRTYLKC